MTPNLSLFVVVVTYTDIHSNLGESSKFTGIRGVILFSKYLLDVIKDFDIH